jgi:hypothetical protein
MKTTSLCDPYFWESPQILLSTGFDVKPRKGDGCASEYLNNVALIFATCITIGILLYFFIKTEPESRSPFGFMMIIATLLSAHSLWMFLGFLVQREGFTDAEVTHVTEVVDMVSLKTTGPSEVYDVIGQSAPTNLTVPTARNPFMNVLIDEIKYNPTRPMAASVMDPSVNIVLDDFFRTEFTSDPTDVFGKTQSQRQFITMPSTSIPNDQGSYQNWLYKIPGKTCKEGGREACLPGTDGGAIPWLNVNPA